MLLGFPVRLLLLPVALLLLCWLPPLPLPLRTLLGGAANELFRASVLKRERLACIHPGSHQGNISATRVLELLALSLRRNVQARLTVPICPFPSQSGPRSGPRPPPGSRALRIGCNGQALLCHDHRCRGAAVSGGGRCRLGWPHVPRVVTRDLIELREQCLLGLLSKLIVSGRVLDLLLMVFQVAPALQLRLLEEVDVRTCAKTLAAPVSLRRLLALQGHVKVLLSFLQVGHCRHSVLVAALRLLGLVGLVGLVGLLLALHPGAT
mmetsp:Transcript_14817/g.40555  ORF Transcript_14817/g.40555 Transcript_14817/m.40555 type:complete len:265 (+) Transcript_14817:83-877(+)